jgi:type II secretory pathway pseudopilin PulG
LAETLIAIGIIGVVSALTIPTLIKNYQKRVIETNLKKTFSEIQNVIKQSKADNGSFEGWDYNLGWYDFMNTYIAPYMKIRQCKSGECFAKEHHNGYYDVWRLANTGETTVQGEYCIMPKFITLDGRHIGFMHGVYNAASRALVFAVDVNGSAGRSVLGEDVFFMSRVFPNGVDRGFVAANQHGWNMSDSGAKSSCYSKTYNSDACGEVIRRNGWKFPKDYPFFK